MALEDAGEPPLQSPIILSATTAAVVSVSPPPPDPLAGPFPIIILINTWWRDRKNQRWKSNGGNCVWLS
ncbi:hypothetical protein M5689_013262 [Euphorbia peplus]|nr:hypothetical protein M5689_013262 [Euphorbia peplus]